MDWYIGDFVWGINADTWQKSFFKDSGRSCLYRGLGLSQKMKWEDDDRKLESYSSHVGYMLFMLYVQVDGIH